MVIIVVQQRKKNNNNNNDNNLEKEDIIMLSPKIKRILKKKNANVHQQINHGVVKVH